MDKEIIIRAQEGDKDAIEFIVNNYKGYVHNVARKLFIKGYLFEDLLQEGVLSIIKGLERYDDSKGNFTGYITKSVQNNFYALIKKRARENYNTSLDKSISEDVTIVDTLTSTTDIERQTCNKELLNATLQAFAKLNKKEQDLIINLQIKNMDPAEYAKGLGISYWSLCKRKERAIKKLKEILKNEFHFVVE